MVGHFRIGYGNITRSGSGRLRYCIRMVVVVASENPRGKVGHILVPVVVVHIVHVVVVDAGDVAATLKAS